MKRIKSFILVSIFTLVFCLSFAGAAGAADSVTTEIRVSPSSLTGAGTVSVTVTIHNNGDPISDVKLAYPAPSTDVMSMGDFATGESKDHTNTQWAISEEMLNTDLKFTVTWTSSDGNTYSGLTDSVPITRKTVEVRVTGSASASDTHVSAGDKVDLSFNIRNEGNVPLTNVVLKAPPIKDGAAINSEPFTVEAGSSRNVEFTLTASETIAITPVFTYTTEGQQGEGTLRLDTLNITVDQPKVAEMSISVSADKLNVAAGDEVTFDVTVRNVGMADLSALEVTDFDGNKVSMNKTSLAAGESATGQAKIDISRSGNYVFRAAAKNPESENVNAQSVALSITVGDAEPTPESSVNPHDYLLLEAMVSRTQLQKPDDVDLTVTVTNLTDDIIKNILLKEENTGKTEAIAQLEAGEKKDWSTILEVDETGEYIITASGELSDGTIIELSTQPVEITVESEGGMETGQIVLIIIIIAIAVVAVVLVIFIRKSKQGGQTPPKNDAYERPRQQVREQQSRPMPQRERPEPRIEPEPKRPAAPPREQTKTSTSVRNTKTTGQTKYGDRNKF
ncbi:MAG: hypothetical protein ACOYJB_02010 [Christensenellaceae bacterium]